MLKFRRQERLSENVTRSFSNLSTRSGSSSQLAPPSLTSPTKRERHSVSGPGAGKAISHDQISAPTRRVSQANVVQEAPSETDWRTKVVWTRHYQSVENMMHQRYERQMPKTSKLLKDVKNSDIVVLQASLEEIFAKLQRRIDQLGDQMDKADAEYLLSRYFNDFVQALKSYLRDCFSDGGEDMQPIPSGIMGDWKKLTRQVAQWNRAYMEHLEHLRKRDSILRAFTQQFEQIEEENYILKDILDKSSTNDSCEITITRIYQREVEPKPKIAHKETNTTDIQAPDIVLSAKPGVMARTLSAVELIQQTAPFAALKEFSVPALAAALKSLGDADADTRIKREQSVRFSHENETVDQTPVLEIEQPPNIISSHRVKELRDAATQMDLHFIPASTGDDKPIPLFRSQETQAELPDEEKERLAMQIFSVEAKIESAQQVHLAEVETLKEGFVTEKIALEQEKEAVAATKNVEIQELHENVSKTVAINGRLEDKIRKLETQISEMEASMGQSKRKNEGLEQHLQDTKIKLQKMEKEFIGSTGALSQLESMYFTALDNIRTLEGEQTARNRLMADLKEQLGNMEKEKGYLERTMSESIKSEKASSARVKELEEELYGAHNGHNKLVDSSLELERMMQMTASKNKELTGMLNVLMKYPDASLGHEITLQDLTSDDEVDTILKEMINSNNLRISLLEQKNNEFRVLRLGQSSRQKGPNLKRQASKDVLYDTESVQRISNSLTLKHLEDQAAMRGSASALSAAPSASKAALRFRSENSYSTSDSRAGSPQQRIPETDSQRAPPRVTTEAWAESGTSNGVGHRHIHPPAPSITRYPPSELVDAYFAERPHTKKPLQQTQFTIPGGTQSPKVYSSLKQHPSSRPGKKLSWNLSSRS